MIRVKSISIREFRGIRDITLELGGKNFAICGPNGTGKSGIVDALEFVLTGNISRLSGEGTGGLSVKDHGPHVDSRDNPEKARVSLTVHIPSLKKDATITRVVKDPKTFTIAPNTPDIQAVFVKVALHPEFALSRRELIRYVLAEPGKRSKDVQALLRLDEVENLRTILQKISNSCARERVDLVRATDTAGNALRQALKLPKLTASTILAAANEQRALLSLSALTSLEANTSIKDGIISATTTQQGVRVSKGQAHTDLATLKESMAALRGAEVAEALENATAAVAMLAQDEAFLKYASREALLRSALAAFDDRACPVCDTPWAPEDFRQRLAVKLEQYANASSRREQAEGKLATVLTVLDDTVASVTTAVRLGALLQPRIDCAYLRDYGQGLVRHIESLRAFLPIGTTAEALAAVHQVPAVVVDVVASLTAAVLALPEPNQLDAARDFLSVGQEKLESYRNAALAAKAAEDRATTARLVFETYGRVTTEALEAIYKNVEGDFTKLYRLINYDDEDKFDAKLKPSLGKLGFDVNFYGRGFFPPGAYHSEGHQDGMGLCLYLALMRHLAGDGFTFAVLDDVLMSVDSGHRREVSKVLLDQFPNTQFILTTHDQIWLRHMKTVGLIEPQRFVHFRTWDVSHGPMEWDDQDVWGNIAAYLQKNDVRGAAALLRHYLEHFSEDICHGLRASVEFRGDAQFNLGDLLPRAIAKMKKLLATGRSAETSWSHTDKVQSIVEREAAFSAVVANSSAEQWQVNAAVHYNGWANLDRRDFVPVVTAFKALVGKFTCAACKSAFYVAPERGEPQDLRCACGAGSVNLIRRS